MFNFYIGNIAGGVVTAAQEAVGSTIALLNPGASDLQGWELTKDGHLILSSSSADLCLSIANDQLQNGAAVTLAEKGASGYFQQWNYDATSSQLSLQKHSSYLLSNASGGPAGPLVYVSTASTSAQSQWNLIVISTLPQPMIGMNWEPAPSDYNGLPAPTKYGDTDFANADFQELWSSDARHDLGTIAGFGCNTIKMYNWSVPAPNGYWMRDHKSFLTAAANAGLTVIVPISNFFTGTAYSNRTQNPNPAGPLPSTQLASWITWIVTEVYANNITAGPVVMWAIGNEYDNSNNGAYGYCEAQDIAMIASLIIAAEASLGIPIANVLPFTSPVTTAIYPVNTSISQANPATNAIMGQYAIQALSDAFSTAGIPATRFIASVNSYQTGAQLTTYNSAFAAAFPGMYWFYGELGWSNANGGKSTQADNLYDQFSTILPLAKAAGSTFLGACCFEYSDELWKGASGSSEVEFGIYTFPANGTPKTALEGDHSPVYGASYPVDVFVARPAVASFIAAIAGQPNPKS
ncbi:RICIN domain-containing protein [Janthinobacterium sp. JC611]|uniref:RICIN domain-containing protein n=1 Tax=Janthinobacterium sp. JC611 TaxID=2816201 RepID=UPI001BFEA8B7|nr:RICIN domain-containing protein [Janthinobacterium sp. JC611]